MTPRKPKPGDTVEFDRRVNGKTDTLVGKIESQSRTCSYVAHDGRVYVIFTSQLRIAQEAPCSV